MVSINHSWRRHNLRRYCRKPILIAFTFGVCCLYSWLWVLITAVQLPDANNSTLFYSTEMHDDLGATFGTAIMRAKSSVTLVIYTLTDRAIIQKLNSKSKEGVKVKIVCDAKASAELDNKLDKGIALIKRFSMGLMHQKILIIDDKQTWIGSANMSSESLRHHGNLVAAIESEALASMATAKAFSLKAYERTQIYPLETFSIGNQPLELWFLPDNSKAISRLRQLLLTAEKSIRIAMFTWTRKDLAYEVIAAHKRGIDVSVVIDKGTSTGASQSIVKLLKKHKVPVRVNKGSQLLHHKFMLVDDSVLVNGSANWTLAAFEKNDDCFFILSALKPDQRVFLSSLWKKIISNSSAR